MKKLCALSLIVLVLCSCVVTPVESKKKFSNVQQENFEEILARNNYHIQNALKEIK
jgi:hypothetical protein